MSSMNPFGLVGVVAVAFLAPHAVAQTLQITSFTPTRNSLANAPGSPIEVVFDRAVNPATFTATPFRFHAFGERSGPILGTFTFLDGDTRVRFTPADPFTRGERVFVTVSEDLAGADGSPFRSSGYSWQFWVAASRASMAFSQVDILDTTQPEISPRPYGGQACDFNNDNAVDICIVNEDTSDLRIFLNNDGALGNFFPFIQPTFPTGPVPSPNEAADFNGDGFADMVTANTSGSTVSVLLGNGDGTFQPRTDYTVGGGPHGVAVLDVDGDGDIDIATANTSGNNVGVIRNNGAGAFGGLTQFDGNGNGEWAINAADMNNDGIMDLVVGARNTGRITVFRGLGNGSFQQGASRTTGFGYWMIVCSDLNGDGHLDVTSAASYSGACIHMGDGLGNLSLPQTFALDGSIATDTGDLDGDGDLDWVLSSFGAGEWYLLENIGGVLTLTDTFFATKNPACAIILDFDVDGALDIALIDEISDEVLLLRNTPVCIADFNDDGTVNSTDVSDFVNAWFTDQANGTLVTDWDDNGVVNSTDVSAFINDWFADIAGACGT